ncbi:hypothetical protein [Lutibacter sp.]|uniref:hypothetical protein n=1 Tax=Lutibacter sp. TaxID=1925666 RepID=UPI0035620C73
MKKIRSWLIILLSIIGINNKLISQNSEITVKAERKQDKTVDISYSKNVPGSYYLKVNFTQLENCYPSKFEGVIKNTTGNLLKLSPINKELNINFSYTYSFIRGNPNPKVNESFLYILPFKKGDSVKILESTQLSEKYFDAEKDSHWKSFIVNRKNADTIYCMRKGIVVEIKDDFKPETFDYTYTSKLNRIVVEHDDGTVARYIGFNKDLITVKLGQTVYPQSKLGVLELFDNELYRLYFDVSFLKEIDFNELKNLNLKSESQSEHINPYFFSKEGGLQLVGSKDYVVEFDEALFFEEFSKREKKMYAKNPLDFK